MISQAKRYRAVLQVKSKENKNGYQVDLGAGYFIYLFVSEKGQAPC